MQPMHPAHPKAASSSRARPKASAAKRVATVATVATPTEAVAVAVVAPGPAENNACSSLPPVCDDPSTGGLRLTARRFLVDRCGLSDPQAHDAEVGAYNWAIERADERRVPRNWRNVRFQSLYWSKARSVAVNFDRSSYVGNERLAGRLAEGEFVPHDVATMQPENVYPERWRDIVEMKVRRDEYILNARPTAMTDQFQCGRCKKRECSYMELQTRSCDEPASLFIQCIRCGHNWRVG